MKHARLLLSALLATATLSLDPPGTPCVPQRAAAPAEKAPAIERCQPPPAPPRATLSLEALLEPWASVTCIDKRDDSTLLVIGQEHYNPIITKDGPQYKGFDKEQSPALPDIQAEIYNIIKTLREKAGLRLVVGEGLGPQPLGVTANEADRYRASLDPRQFIADHLKEMGYTIASDAFEDLLVIGVDDKMRVSSGL